MDADSCRSSNAYYMPGGELITYVNGLIDVCQTPLMRQALGWVDRHGPSPQEAYSLVDRANIEEKQYSKASNQEACVHDETAFKLRPEG